MIKYFCDRCGKEMDKGRQMYTGAYDGLGVLLTTIGPPKHLCEECSDKLDAIKDQLEHEEDIFDMTDEDIELLRYTFKVGDKVIESDGLTGTVKEVCTCSKCKQHGFYELTVEMEDGSVDYVVVTDKERGFDSYYSIGDRVFGNLKEEYVTKKMNEAWETHKRLIKQLGTIRTLKQKGWSANGL